MLHVAKVGFISRRQKTAKAECGKTVPADNIAVAVDADCPACRATVEATIRASEELLRHAKEIGLPNAAEIEASLPRWRAEMYRTPFFL